MRPSEASPREESVSACRCGFLFETGYCRVLLQYGQQGLDEDRFGFQDAFRLPEAFYGYEVRDIQLCYEVGRRLRGRRLFSV